MHCCGEFLQKRDDDNVDVAVKRFETYVESTEPVLEFYKKMNLLIRSTSFLLNDNLAWGKISNNKISFSEYNDLFSNFKN